MGLRDGVFLSQERSLQLFSDAQALPSVLISERSLGQDRVCSMAHHDCGVSELPSWLFGHKEVGFEE